MMRQALTRTERDKILQGHRVALANYEASMNFISAVPPWSEREQRAMTEAGVFLQQVEQAEADYFTRLPRLTLSCCPFDRKLLTRSFDPFGLDGLWWRADATPEEVPACPHFCVLVGAVNFAGRQPHAGDFEVQPGPQVPYVIPRLLDYRGMYAVISQLKMANGYVAYPIAYFAERRPPPQDLTAGWARTNYVYRTLLGEDGWTIPNDAWDFDLRPWVDAGKIRWCAPDSDRSVLSADLPYQCPYVNLRGERQRMIVQGNRAWTRGVPSGEPLWPVF
jgi:hypothetical protein